VAARALALACGIVLLSGCTPDELSFEYDVADLDVLPALPSSVRLEPVPLDESDDCEGPWCSRRAVVVVEQGSAAAALSAVARALTDAGWRKAQAFPRQLAMCKDEEFVSVYTVADSVAAHGARPWLAGHDPDLDLWLTTGNGECSARPGPASSR